MTHRFSSRISKLLTHVSTAAVVAAATILLLLPSPASAQDTPLSFSGTIQVGGQTFTANNGIVITSGSSGISFAHISGPEGPNASNNFKGCSDFHLHGIVNGQSDPDPFGCGWGIINFLGAPPPPFFDHPHTFGEHLINVFPDNLSDPTQAFADSLATSEWATSEWATSEWAAGFPENNGRPILLQATDQLDERVRAEIERLGRLQAENPYFPHSSKEAFEAAMQRWLFPPGGAQEGTMAEGPILLFNPDGSFQQPTLQLPVLVDYSLFAPHPPFPGSNLTFPIGDTPPSNASPGDSPTGNTPTSDTPVTNGGTQPASSPWSEINDEMARLAEMARLLESLKRRAARATGNFKTEADNEVRRYEREVNEQNRKVMDLIQQQIQSTINAINAANAAGNTPQPTPR